MQQTEFHAPTDQMIRIYHKMNMRIFRLCDLRIFSDWVTYVYVYLYLWVNWGKFVYILIVSWFKEKAATLQVLSSTVQELAYQIAPADGVQQFVHQLSCSLIGCNRTVTIPNEATNKIKQHRDSSIPSPSHSVKTHKYDSSIGVEDDNQIIFNLLLNQH